MDSCACVKSLLRAVLAAVSISLPGSSEIFRVNLESTAPVPDGLSWATAFSDIQSAVDVAEADGGGEVWVAVGTYTAGTDPVLTMKENVALYGGFACIESVREERDCKRNETVIDGENTRRCVLGIGGGRLDGFTISHGYSAELGGGMYNKNDFPYVGNCIFKENRAEYGAGMANQGNYIWSTATGVDNCIFINNTAIYGGGMFNIYCGPLVKNCFFASNVAVDSGGGMANSSSMVEIRNSLFLSNAAGNRGGGISYSTPTFSHLIASIVWGNSAPESGQIYCYYGSDCYEGECIRNSPYVIYSCIEEGYHGTGNISTDPLLIGTPGSTGMVRPASPCIDSGTSWDPPITDIRGILRPQNGRYDMGIYELDDSDSDEISDAWEIAHFGNLTSATESSDADGDGLSDTLESCYAADPFAADTDGDGISDGDEVTLGWDPTLVSGIRRVNVAQHAGVHDGLTWETAFENIQDAVDSIDEGEVWVAVGTYTGLLENVVTMKQHVPLYGGFAGIEAVREERDWEHNVTIVNGESERRCVMGASESVLDGFTLKNGHADFGGGMDNEYASPKVVNCKFTGNTADHGGGIYSRYSITEISNCLFSRNSAAEGAGIQVQQSQSSISDCHFEENSANYGGGGISFDDSQATISSCVFQKNDVRDGNGGGISIHSWREVTSLDNCIFISNKAYKCGAGTYCNPNSSYGGKGGGLSLVNTKVNVMNCSFTENDASSGGGVYSQNSSLTFTNSIAWGDRSRDGEIFAETSTFSVTYSCVEGGYEGEGNIAENPLFAGTSGSLGRIFPDSPCIDAGTDSINLDKDIRGVARPQGMAPDMGAYELDDSDHDGISDYWEQTFFENLTSADAFSDSDGDGMFDAWESIYGSDPFRSDSDGDGYGDGDEVARGWDPAVPSGVRRVRAENTSGVEDGLSWETAFRSIQFAIDAIEEGEVWVAAGTYSGTAENVVVMKNKVDLYGGFDGTETERNARDWERNISIIDGESEHRGIYIYDNVVFDGFNVQNGYSQRGSAILCIDSSPVVSNCTFNDNESGIGNYFSSPSIINCTFSYIHEGAVYNYKSTALLENCSFFSLNFSSYGAVTNEYSDTCLNHCRFFNLYSDKCAAIYNIFSSPVLDDCVFKENRGNIGGAMYNVSSTPVLNRCEFNGNTSGETGGAIYNENSSPVLTACSFLRNTSEKGGGMYNNSNSCPLLNACTFVENMGSVDGGGMYNSSGSSPVLYNCTFIENDAIRLGGGIGNDDASPEIVHCTFLDNRAMEGSVMSNSGASTPIVRNSILWGRSSATAPAIYVLDSTPVIVYSCIEGGYEGVGNIAGDPLPIRTPAANGRIRPESPCIDAASAEGAPDTDIRGVSRPQGAGYDMGAYELDDTDGDGISDSWELSEFSDLAGADNGSDADGDGLSDLLESLYGSDPLDADTDGDGYEDGDDVSRGWDPVRVSGIRMVRAEKGSGVEDGLTWETAFSSIQTAVDALDEGEVWIAAGNYSVTDSPGVAMRRRVSLFGGFNGTETVREARDWANNVTIIHGGNSNKRCIVGAGDATLDGFTVRDGFGGMFNGYAMNITIAHCLFIENHNFGGGAIHNAYSTPTIHNCVFIDNNAYMGGAIMNIGSSPNIVNCTFTKNFSHQGGALHDIQSSTTVKNSILWGNESDFGKEFFSVDSTLDISYSCFPGGQEGTGNIASDPLFAGTISALGHLESGSPCIDAGQSAVASADDIRGVPRPFGGAADMGAYELDDSDGDGISDTWERAFFGDLASSSAQSDTDSDGLPDALESILGSDPFNADTDGDGFSDGLEREKGWDPARVSGVRRVAAANVSGTQDGLSWESAFTNIQSAVDALDEGEIWVAGGTYTATDGVAVAMKQHVNLYGGFSGLESERSARDPGMHETVIDGIHTYPCVSGANDTTLDGFTIARGASEAGAGIFILCLTMQINECLFTDNASEDDGGGLSAFYAWPTVSNCIFSGNTANFGGGFFNGYSFSTISNCIFVNNSAEDGGGISNYYNANAEMANCVFYGNIARLKGGGMHNFNMSSPLLLNCIFWGDSSVNGSEIFNDNFVYNPEMDCTPTVSYSCIQEGYAGVGNIASDPLFIDAVNRDFRLQSASPCKDKGTSADAPASDFLGVARPQGAGFDMGAYESTETGGGEPVPDYHSADTNTDHIFQLVELLRMVQFFNLSGYACDTSDTTSDGYIPGEGSNYECRIHSGDFDGIPWRISLTELLRVIQFFNVGGYHPCPGMNTNDGYCPGLGAV